MESTWIANKNNAYRTLLKLMHAKHSLAIRLQDVWHDKPLSLAQHPYSPLLAQNHNCDKAIEVKQKTPWLSSL